MEQIFVNKTDTCFVIIGNKNSKSLQDIVFEKINTLSSERIKDINHNHLDLGDELNIFTNEFEYVTSKTRIKFIRINYDDHYSEIDFIEKVYKIFFKMKLTHFNGFILFMDEFKQMKPFTNTENIARCLKFFFDSKDLNEKVLVLSWNNEAKNEHTYCNKYQIGLLEEILSVKLINCFFFYYYRSSFDILNRFLTSNRSFQINIDLEKMETQLKIKLNSQIEKLIQLRDRFEKCNVSNKINKIELKIKLDPESVPISNKESVDDIPKECQNKQTNFIKLDEKNLIDSIIDKKDESFKSFNQVNQSIFQRTITKYEHKSESKHHYSMKIESKNN